MGTERGGQPEPPLRRLVSVARAYPAIALAVLVCLAGGIYVGFGLLWPSDRARIVAATRHVCAALERGDADAVLEHVSPYFSEEGVDRRELNEYLHRALRRNAISSVRLSVRQVSVDGPRASARVHVLSTHEAAYGGRLARSEWLLRFERINDRWLIRQATPLQVNARSVAGLRTVMALGY